MVYVRGGIPSKAQYCPNVVHSSPARPEVFPGFGSQRDIVKTGRMVQCDLLCLFPRTFCDFPTPSIWKGECLHKELRYRASQISRGLLGSTLSGRYMRGRGWALVSATTVDHGARLPFCTRNYISISTHQSCEVGTWFGSLMGVASASLNWKPSKIPADTGSMDSLRRSPPM